MIFYMHECERRLGYVFHDKNLLRTCFTHSSFTNEHAGGDNNERLEFFGDSVLGFIVAEYLTEKYPTAREGKLTEYKQSLVSSKPLTEAIEREGLGEFILYGEGAKKAKASSKKSAEENLYEAIVAGLYIDGGIAEAKKFVTRTLLSKVKPEKAGKGEPSADINYKGRLQEYAQKYKLGAVRYETVSKTGPDHEPTFGIAVEVGGKRIATAKGKSKSDAAKEAARVAYEKLSSDR